MEHLLQLTAHDYGGNSLHNSLAILDPILKNLLSLGLVSIGWITG